MIGDFMLTAHDIDNYTVSGRIQWWVRALSFSAAGAFFILWRFEYYPLFSFISGLFCCTVWLVFVIIHIVQVVRELRGLEDEIEDTDIEETLKERAESSTLQSFYLSDDEAEQLYSFLFKAEKLYSFLSDNFDYDFKQKFPNLDDVKCKLAFLLRK